MRLYTVRKTISAILKYVAAILLVSGGHSHLLLANDSCVALVSPSLDSNYTAVVDSIAGNIQDSVGYPVVKYEVTEKNSNELLSSIKCEAAVGIGRIGMNLVSKLDTPAVAALVFAKPEEKTQVAVYSLVVEPVEIFRRTKYFLPSVRTVHVVYDPQQSSELVKIAEKQAREYNLTLISYEVQSIRDALTQYDRILNAANGSSEALWLLQDPTTIDSNSVLQFILKKSWDRSIPIFSSQAALAKYGALFSLFPDSHVLAEQVVNHLKSTMRKNRSNVDGDGGVRLLSATATAVNVRSIDHLGLNVNVRNNKHVQRIFPER